MYTMKMYDKYETDTDLLERETHRDRQRQRGRETKRQRDRETERRVHVIWGGDMGKCGRGFNLGWTREDEHRSRKDGKIMAKLF